MNEHKHVSVSHITFYIADFSRNPKGIGSWDEYFFEGLCYLTGVFYKCAAGFDNFVLLLFVEKPKPKVLACSSKSANYIWKCF
jgi:hypothetical protein